MELMLDSVLDSKIAACDCASCALWIEVELITSGSSCITLLLLFATTTLFMSLSEMRMEFKSVTDCQSKMPTRGFLNLLLGLVIAGGIFMEAGAFATRVGTIRKFAKELRYCVVLVVTVLLDEVLRLFNHSLLL